MSSAVFKGTRVPTCGETVQKLKQWVELKNISPVNCVICDNFSIIYARGSANIGKNIRDTYFLLSSEKIHDSHYLHNSENIGDLECICSI